MLKKALSSILCLGALAASLPAAASALYGVSFDGPTPLYSVNTSTGALAAIGPTGGRDIGDLTSDTRAASFRLWGVDLTENLLHTFDTGSGAISSTVAISLEDRITSIAFDTVSGKLYGTPPLASARLSTRCTRSTPTPASPPSSAASCSATSLRWASTRPAGCTACPTTTTS
jgi:hypothetical protein